MSSICCCRWEEMSSPRKDSGRDRFLDGALLKVRPLSETSAVVTGAGELYTGRKEPAATEEAAPETGATNPICMLYGFGWRSAVSMISLHVKQHDHKNKESQNKANAIHMHVHT